MEISAVAISVISGYGTNYSDTKSRSFADALRDWAEESGSIFSDQASKKSDSISDEPSKSEFKNFRIYNENAPARAEPESRSFGETYIYPDGPITVDLKNLKHQTPAQLLALGRAMNRTSAWDDRALWNLY